MMYQTEYKRLPALPEVAVGKDAVIETSAASGIVSVLVAMPDNALVAKLNRRGIQYYSDKVAKTADKLGIFRSGGEAQLKDPWGNFYLVYLDTNGDGQIEITYPDGKTEVIKTSAAVRCLGPNSVIDHTPGERKDDFLAK